MDDLKIFFQDPRNQDPSYGRLEVIFAYVQYLISSHVWHTMIEVVLVGRALYIIPNFTSSLSLMRGDVCGF